ncbi:uncharacterized protein MELLADRAFT_86064 [Melampsora larici-populina 98AG31]|uniref:Uncharacterized protein n=1 Tax=Melampsora larici-populina (strain 98AG31 / pathotype 3-4-7) TaxID=747676 RepID=F4RKM8_MELLP|nr:uncharacterized protein MELLADRAFT_86064 [Melampsora larici-populina 98AG31]EGG07120.1 hypothetical protein MELLADRAFT_86064 [Melampsora larici-populina 98AG31]
MLGRTMLGAYEAMYGDIPFDPEAETRRGRRSNREPVQTGKRRPRTESLIADEDPNHARAPARVSTKKTRKLEPEPEATSTVTRAVPNPVQATSTIPSTSSSNNLTSYATPKAKGKGAEKEEEDSTNPEEDITFVDDQQLSNNSLLKLSHCFHQRMTKLKSYVPLTVFNMDWIDRDSEKASQKKLKTVKELQEGDDTMTYSGLQPKDELLLSYGEWIDHMDLFIRYVEEYYHMPKCAENFRQHKTNVIDIRRSTSCWMVALRYCIKVRKLVMQHRMVEGKCVMSNAGVLHEDILRAAKDKAESLGERSHAENPYIATVETPDLSVAKERSLIKREFAAANQNNSHGSWRNGNREDQNGGRRGKSRYQKNKNRNDRRNENDQGRAHESGQHYNKGHTTFPFNSFGGHYQHQSHLPYQPYVPYQSYSYASGSNQGFNQGGTTAGPSEPSNQLAIVPKPGTSGGGNQNGALAIVHRNNTNKCLYGFAPPKLSRQKRP